MRKHVLCGAKPSEKTLLTTRQSLGQYLRNACREHQNKIFMVDAETGKYSTWNDVLDRSRRIASFLVQSGCSAGSVIGVICETSLNNPALLLATLNVGAIYTSVNFLASTNEISHKFGLSKASIIFTSSKSHEKVKSLQSNCPSIRLIVNVDEVVFPECDKEFQYHDANPKDVAIISYSSGTTGLPKGVLLSHTTWIYVIELYRTEKIVTFPENNVAVGLVASGHVYELHVQVSCMVLGYTYVWVGKSEQMYGKYIEKFKVSTIYSTPFAAGNLLKDIMTNERDMSSVKLVISGGDFLRADIRKSLTGRLGCNFFDGYGMNETAGFSLYVVDSSKIGAVGRLVPGMQAQIVDISDGEILGPVQQGELCLRGPMLFNGYLGAVNNDALDSEGWFHTGDIAYYDYDHDFFIVERLKQLMKCGGFQVSPLEIETLVLQRPGVADVAVVGIRGKANEEDLPRAYVVKKSGHSVTEDDIKQYVASNITPVKHLRGGVKFVESLPKTESGKIDRKEMKHWASNGL